MNDSFGPIDLIREHGDAVEKVAFRDASFAGRFEIYARVWASYILPNRDPAAPHRTLEPWHIFSQAHYTAFVRMCNASQAASRITLTCRELGSPTSAANQDMEFKVDAILRLHESLLSLFGCYGAVRDNLIRAFASRPLNKESEGIHEFARYGEAEFTPEWVYDRRSQHVHSILVPIFQTDNKTMFDGSLWVDKKCRWEDASGEPKDFRVVSDYINDIHTKYSTAISSIWHVLFTRLQSTVIAPPISPGLAKVTLPSGFSGINYSQAANSILSGSRTGLAG